MTNLSCSVTNVSTTNYLILGRILPQVGKLKTLANMALERPLGSMTTGRSVRAAAMRGEVLWHVSFPLLNVPGDGCTTAGQAPMVAKCMPRE